MSTQLFPLWKEAVKKFLENDPKPGTLIRNDWLMSMFGIAEPVTAEDQKKASLAFLTAFQTFRDDLLENYLIDLKSVHGIGYEVIDPKEQAQLAFKTRTRNVSRELSKMAKSIAFTDLTKLSESEKQSHTDSASKAASLKTMFNRRALLGRD